MIIIITSSVSLIGISILIYAIFGRNSVSNVGFDSSFALIDILTYSIILTVSIQYQTNVRVFKSLLIISCFGTLVGEFVGKELARNLPANSIIFPVFMLAIVFIFVFTMPWTTKYINVMLELRTKPDMPPANYEEQRIANNPLPADLFGDFIRRAKTLTPAERTIFDYYLEGKSNKEIISLMYISLSTLKTHNSHIYAKLNVSSRDELSLYAELIRKSGKLADIK